MSSVVVGRAKAWMKAIMVAVIISLAAAPFAQADTRRGTAPFCEGKCLLGEQQVATSTRQWRVLLTGHKALCATTRR